MKKSLLLILCCFLFEGIVKGQVTQNYSPLLSKGTLPNEVITSSVSRYKSELAEGEANPQFTKFLLSNRFEVDYLIRSNWVVHNPEISNYFASIAAILLKDDPALRKKLKFYLLKSSSVNAFASHDGSIFVSIGTLAHLENEAQLAFILAHEIIHVKERHSFNKYIEYSNMQADNEDGDTQANTQSKKKKRKKKEYKIRDIDENFDPNLLKKCRFSQNQESMADERGLQLFLKTAYDFSACNEVFDHLKFAALPYQNIPFETDFLLEKGLVFPNNYFLKEVSEFKGQDEDRVDSMVSHPNIKKRREGIANGIKGLENKGKKLFLVSQDLFNQLQHTARFELPQLFLHENAYTEALYYSYLLNVLYPDNPYIEKCIAKSLYGIHVFQHRQPDRSDLQGEIQQVHHFLSKLTKDEAYVLALHYIWRLKEKYANDAEVMLLWTAIGERCVKQERLTPAYFLAEKTGRERDTSGWSKYLLAEALKSEEVQKIFMQEKEPQKQPSDSTSVNTVVRTEAMTDPSGFILYDDLNTKWEKALKLGIEKVVIVNPQYLKLNLRAEGEGVMFAETEAGEKDLVAALKKNAESIGLKTTILHHSELTHRDMDNYNDIVLLEEWKDEQFAVKDAAFLGTRQAQINEIAKKYGTDYFVWVGIVDADMPKDKKKLKEHLFSNSIYFALFPQFWGLYWYEVFKKESLTLMYVLVYEVKTGKSQVIKKNVYNLKTTPKLTDVQLYDAFLQIHTQNRRHLQKSQGKVK